MTNSRLSFKSSGYPTLDASFSLPSVTFSREATRLVKVKKTIRKFFTAMKTGDMTRTLNPVIRGWANYHRQIVASDTFKEVNNQIYC